MLDHVAIFQVYFQHFFMPIHVWKVVSPCKFTSRLEDELTVKFRLVFYTWSLFMMRFFRFEGHITCLFFSDSLLSFCGRSLLLAMIDEETSRSPKHPKAHCTTTKVFEVWSYLFFEIIPLGFTECSSLSHLPGATIRLKSLSLDSSVVLDRDGPFCAATVAKGVEKQMTNIHI